MGLKDMFLNKKENSFEANLFGTNVKIIACGENSKKAIKCAKNRLMQLHSKLSVFDLNSEVYKINHSSERRIKVSDDIFYLLKKGKEYFNLTEGNSDLTIEPLVKLWSVGKKDFDIPSKDAVELAKKYVGFEKVKIEDENYITLEKFQMISFASIAKGFATDEVRKIFLENGVESGVINLGGNVFVLGKKQDNSYWNVGIQNPFKQTGEYMGVLSLANKSVVSSGGYERNSVKNNITYGHIIDVKTGCPVDNEMAGITIISDNSIDGDGLSTGLYILGYKRAIEIVDSLNGVECVCITKNKEVYLSEGLKGKFLVLGL